MTTAAFERRDLGSLNKQSQQVLTALLYHTDPASRSQKLERREPNTRLFGSVKQLTADCASAVF